MRNLKYVLFLYAMLLLSISNAQIIPKSPDMAVPSPQAATFTRYGNVAVNEARGEINPSIPIFNYSVGKINVPIELNYSGIGVKVTDRATWTGMSWFLETGGVITRTVRDLPDETVRPRILYSKQDFDNMIDSRGNLPSNIWNNFAVHTQDNDSESDLFNFNFPGYSGSFVLKQNVEDGSFEPKLLKYDKELKIELLGNFSPTENYQFKITSPDGISYFFGGFVGENGVDLDENGNYEIGYAVEESQFIYVFPTSGLRNYGPKAKTAFYLTKIEDYLGNKVFFEYYTKDEYTVLTNSNYTASRRMSDSPPNLDLDYSCEPKKISNRTHDYTPPQKNYISNGKFLKKIWTPNSPHYNKVLFISEEKNRKIGSREYFLTRILKEIHLPKTVVNLEYTPTKSYLINHPNSNRDKFFLSEVTFKNTSIPEEKTFKMEYKGSIS